MLAREGVRHIAVIEVSLRASEESGLLGVDLTTAPFEEIADEVVAAVERRAIEAQNGPAQDEMAESIARLEDATRELAMERVASALMRIDERTRERLLGLSLAADTNGARMDGMLTVIARMKPAALARLLCSSPARLVPTHDASLRRCHCRPRRPRRSPCCSPRCPTSLPTSVSPTLPRPPRSPRRWHAPRTPDPSSDRLRSRLLRLRPVALSQLRPPISGPAPTPRAWPLSARCCLPQRATGRCPPFAKRSADLTSSVPSHRSQTRSQMARGTLADPAVLRDVCRACQTDADATIAGESSAAGQPGAEALLDSYIRMSEPQRSLFRPVLRGTSEMVLGVARPRLRTAEPAVAVTIVARSRFWETDARRLSLRAPLRAASTSRCALPQPMRSRTSRRPRRTQYLIRCAGTPRGRDPALRGARTRQDSCWSSRVGARPHV